ncbi:Rossmann-like alpha beta alpha sandwich fold [Pyrenophora seminiperda CCB06]|uniref:Rossmann-like alpha beta alpha sandwich fold n=1 Tax=Pyrenophora seminiperda CCB06 TaxID=1302712 RepID=A0A3M7M295_9PLEO|nr:Rossmann-like alpha beta alpha sandwich fold [Pyrenophora seminiperda CCB06]
MENRQGDEHATDTAHPTEMETEESIHTQKQLQRPETDPQEGPEAAVSSMALNSRSPTPIIQPPLPHVKTAHLETYILRAEALEQSLFPARMLPVFSSSPYSTPPTLRSDRENRIVSYKGCFNPPHAGHVALLAHTYLSTDASTVAVMIRPTGGVGGKPYLHSEEGRHFQLTQSQRGALWQDDLLSRFSWIMSGTSETAHRFMNSIVALARHDGFRISFDVLTGGDHPLSSHPAFWPDHVHRNITSDITRDVFFVDATDGQDPRVLDFCVCSPWEDVPPPAVSTWEGEEGDEKPACWPCWPCHKMKAVFPEGFDKTGRLLALGMFTSLHFPPYISLTKPLDPSSSPPTNPAASPSTLLARCHASPTPVKQCQWIKNWDDTTTYHLLFIPSTHDPESPGYCFPADATSIRKAFLEVGNADRVWREEMRGKVMNVDMLCGFLGWERVEKRKAVVEEEVEEEEGEEDLMQLDGEGEDDGNEKKRRRIV